MSGSAASSDTTSSATAHTHEKQDPAASRQRQSPRRTDNAKQHAKTQQRNESAHPRVVTCDEELKQATDSDANCKSIKTESPHDNPGHTEQTEETSEVKLERDPQPTVVEDSDSHTLNARRDCRGPEGPHR